MTVETVPAPVDWERLAPYPLTEDMVTAANMSRWLAVQSYRSLRIEVPVLEAAWRSMPDGLDQPEYDIYAAAVKAATAEGLLALVLRELPQRRANEVAVDVWRLVDGDPDALAAELVDLLESIGIDPEQVAG